MRTRLALAAPLLLIALTACSGGGDTDDQSLEPTASPTSAATTAATGSATAPPSVTKPSAAATSQATAATTTQAPVAATGAPKPLSTRAPGKEAASKATAPGDYTYRSSGTVTLGTTPQDASGEQTLTISPLVRGIQHSRLHSEDTGDTDQDVVVRDTGSYLASLKLTSPAFTKEFRPDPAVLLMPDPATVGRTWSWTAVSTDGKTTAKATNKLVRKETVTIGGKAVSTVVLSTHLVLTDPDFTYTGDVTVNWAPDYRLPVKQRVVGKGTYAGIPFKSDVTGVLTSLKPQ